MKTKTNTELVIPLVKDDVDGVKDTSVFKSIIGQTEARNKLGFYTQSHCESIPVMETLLFTGSQGLGKSYMAEKCAQAIGRKLITINCSSLDTIDNFIYSVLLGKVAGNEQVTLFFDESHALPNDITDALLTFLAPNPTNKNTYQYKNLTIEYDFRKINTIFATTDVHKMDKALVNRCKQVYFYKYSNEELFDILKMYLPGIELACDKSDVSFACRGRARDAFMLASDINRYCMMMNTNRFGNEGWNYIKRVFGICPLGLHNEEIQLLKTIAGHSPISSGSLAVMMGVNVQNIESEIEVRPRELGFIENGTRGRILTVEGMNYLKKILE